MATNQSFKAGVLREQWTNATQPTDPTPAGYTAWDQAGSITAQRALTAAEVTQLASADGAYASDGNQSTIRQQAQTALVNNRAYLAVASPTNAQVVAQLRAITQQNQGLIRLALSQFDATN